ncbi:secreted RxLR effector protein 161-like [Nicotiana sylvestris]|uniref:secreted RxLR effector protein 161-like n=1 Tax=Nicotiana sylvestris TaxID=4096 RepID=UPI00388C4BAC
MTNGKADMMSQVKDLSEDNTASSSTEPGTSITTTEAEEIVVDAVQGSSRLQKYIRELLKRFDMEASKVIDTPITMATRLDMDENGSLVNQTMYRGIIGSLIYLTANRPDIFFSVGIFAKFQSNPKESHWKAAKRILRYLKGTQDLVLVDRKSTSGMAHFLGSCLISWGTRKQNSVALSTAEAEYVAAASCYAQLLWIK